MIHFLTYSMKFSGLAVSAVYSSNIPGSRDHRGCLFTSERVGGKHQEYNVDQYFNKLYCHRTIATLVIKKFIPKYNFKINTE